jgi:hypothetical protein
MVAIKTHILLTHCIDYFGVCNSLQIERTSATMHSDLNWVSLSLARAVSVLLEAFSKSVRFM